MALYIMLSTLSERGRQVVKKLPGSIRKVNQEVGRMGVRVRDPLKRQWERSVFLGAGSTNQEAVRRAQEESRA